MLYEMHFYGPQGKVGRGFRFPSLASFVGVPAFKRYKWHPSEITGDTYSAKKVQAATGHLTFVLGYGWKLIAISSLIIDIALKWVNQKIPSILYSS